MEKYLHVSHGVINPHKNHLSIGSSSHKLHIEKSRINGEGLLLKNITHKLNHLGIKSKYQLIPANVVGGFNSGLGTSHKSDTPSAISIPIPTGGSILHSVRLKHSDYHKKPLEIKTKHNNIRFVL